VLSYFKGRAIVKKLVFLLCLLSFVSFSYGKSYSSGSRSSSSSHSYSSSSSRSYSAPSGKSYSSGRTSNTSSSPKSYSSPQGSSTKTSFFGKAEKAQAKQDSKASYDKYKASQQSYDYLKQQPKEVYTTRTVRQKTVFNNYYQAPQPVVYRDTSWNPFFWMWLLDHPTRQADWVYNHRSELSDERYRDLLAKNKDLESQIKALEDKKAVKDPNYAPPEIDKDLMYSDDYVKEVQKDSKSFDWILWLLIPISVLISVWGIWAIFFKKRSF
jgi:hypothetical protein